MKDCIYLSAEGECIGLNCICTGEPTACLHYEKGAYELSGYPCTCCTGCSMFEPAEEAEL